MSPPPLVPDLLKPGLKLVFCGTAPSLVSAREKAYYAHPGNIFWLTLHRIGITPILLKPSQYASLLTLGIGLTDLCKTVAGSDASLPTHAIVADEVREKIKRYKPKIVAFTSKHGAELFFGQKVNYGLQPIKMGQTQFFTLCSTSGRARRFWREEIWMELAALLGSKR